MDIAALLDRQRSYFATGATLPVEKRLAALRRLKKEIQNCESAIAKALQADLGKAPFESYMTETGMVLDELGYVEKTHAAVGQAEAGEDAFRPISS